ncbi:hypothetical protein [Xanthomonas sp. XNM01]|uniref:hypothetical protein n=1 Tax=Xanthomonas sp. XNM01 TaxID=2769289 RepID=UPI00177E1DBE|nr:hypothetical protein [Xanthomonas sp. XNM01]MBD9368720.1 hypothetical protein [Xanthomonas sp. XNM01]
MDVRFLSLAELERAHFYRAVTLSMLVAIGILLLIRPGDASPASLALVGAGLGLLAWRFAVEWRRLGRCVPVVPDGDGLLIVGDAAHRRIALADIAAVTSRHSILTVRRYRSWSEHLAFVEIRLRSGARVHTLAESAVFEHPPARDSLAALRAAVAAARRRST